MRSESPHGQGNLSLAVSMQPGKEIGTLPGRDLRVEMVSDVRFSLLFSGARGPRREQAQSPIRGLTHRSFASRSPLSS